MQRPTRVYEGADANLHTSHSDSDVDVPFVSSYSLFSRKTCYRTFWIFKPILFIENRTPPNLVLRKYVSNKIADRYKIF
jgi:hypothetical protein